MSNRSDETLTASDMTPAEAAAWEVAVARGLNITRLDLRYLLEAADRVRTRGTLNLREQE